MTSLFSKIIQCKCRELFKFQTGYMMWYNGLRVIIAWSESEGHGKYYPGISQYNHFVKAELHTYSGLPMLVGIFLYPCFVWHLPYCKIFSTACFIWCTIYHLGAKNIPAMTILAFICTVWRIVNFYGFLTSQILKSQHDILHHTLKILLFRLIQV